MHYTCKYFSPLGCITLAGSDGAITGLWFDGQKYFAANLPEVHEEKEVYVFKQAKEWLDIYFSGKEPDFTPPLSMSGISAFRKRAWEIMQEIPYGQTLSYGNIAKRLEHETGKKVSAQAVGGAVGHNCISIIIPCHRVVGTNGSITGYAGGIEKKRALLSLEGADMSKLIIPEKGSAL